MSREVQDAVQRTERALATEEGARSLAADNQVGAVLRNPQQRQQYEDQLREQGLLGRLTIDFVGRNSAAIDTLGNGNGSVDRTELQAYIGRNGSNPFNAFAARHALRGMEQNRITELSQTDLGASRTRMQPEAASMRQAIDQFPGIRDVMRSLDPSTVDGNNVNVGALRTALERNGARFTEAQRQAAATLLRPENLNSIAESASFLGGLRNGIWSGNDGRYLNPELMERRATALGGERNPAEDQARQAREELARRFNSIRGEQGGQTPGNNPRETGTRRAGEPRNYETGNDSRFNEYTVRSGDTMWHIAREFMQRNNANGEAPTNQQIDRMYRAIARENGISNPNSVPLGTRLRIPREYQPIITNPARQRN
ncbi:MAG: LysM peptidoglycan-binding domain-containing protein [Candidatus Melainabacteria bacterium]|jgi:hypothetical protein|nr:LysM peptidoglycan-binding domain-containing protein [Candidatus Melainabacteria bacterium]